MKEIVSNLILVLRKNMAFFAISLLAFALLYSFFYGIFTIPVLEIGFFKDAKPGVLDYSYILLSSILSASIVTLTKYSAKNKLSSRGAATLGIASGAFATICPVCLGVNFLLLGSFITLPLVSLVPYAIWIQMAGLAVLALSLWLTVKSSYGNICLACTAKTEKKTDGDLFGAAFSPAQKYIFLVLLVIAALSLGLQIIPTAGASQITGAATAGHGSLNVDEITLQVLPEKGFTIDARWGDSVAKMVKSGVLDMDKLNDLLTKRYGQPLTEGQKKLLADDYSEEKLTINSKNAVFMMYLLWVLAKHNDNAIIHASPWELPRDIGVGRDGWGDVKLVELTEEQQKLAKEVAQNAYRPCCGQPTSKPDCSHGFSALGLIELMASQDFTKEQIFDAFVKFNSFWFPETYIMNAMYFKLSENKDWNDVDKEVVSGYQYSSAQGKYNVRKYLEGLGL